MTIHELNSIESWLLSISQVWSWQV